VRDAAQPHPQRTGQQLGRKRDTTGRVPVRSRY
jgi:hypothetical protein